MGVPFGDAPLIVVCNFVVTESLAGESSTLAWRCHPCSYWNMALIFKSGAGGERGVAGVSRT